MHSGAAAHLQIDSTPTRVDRCLGVLACACLVVPELEQLARCVLQKIANRRSLFARAFCSVCQDWYHALVLVCCSDMKSRPCLKARALGRGQLDADGRSWSQPIAGRHQPCPAQVCRPAEAKAPAARLRKLHRPALSLLIKDSLSAAPMPYLCTPQGRGRRYQCLCLPRQLATVT